MGGEVHAPLLQLYVCVLCECVCDRGDMNGACNLGEEGEARYTPPSSRLCVSVCVCDEGE